MVKTAFIDMSGKTWGDWEVLHRGADKYNYLGYVDISWTCRCRLCGTIRDVLGRNLRNGRSTSCGCTNKKPRGLASKKLLNKVGIRYGRGVVQSFNDEVSVEKGYPCWNLLCDCNNTYIASGSHLVTGHTRSCGCFSRDRARETNLGSLSPSYNGGITELRKKIRDLPEYNNWRIFIFIRDNRTCQKCGYQGQDIEVHHMIPLNVTLDKRRITNVNLAIDCQELWDTGNGITLCKDCHKLLHKLFGRKDYDIEKVKSWIASGK